MNLGDTRFGGSSYPELHRQHCRWLSVCYGAGHIYGWCDPDVCLLCRSTSRSGPRPIEREGGAVREGKGKAVGVESLLQFYVLGRVRIDDVLIYMSVRALADRRLSE